MHCCFDARQKINLKNNTTSTLNVLQQKFRKTTRIKKGRYVNRQTLRGLENVSYSERMNILGLETLNRRRVIFDLILCYKHLHGLVEINNCNFVRIYQSSRTRGNGMKLYIRNSAVSMRDINSSLTALLTFGTFYLQQSYLAIVWLFLNEI